MDGNILDNQNLPDIGITEWCGVTNSVEQTEMIAATIARMAHKGDVVGLVGELGAGKTQFVRGLALGLGINPSCISSPTFVIHHEYENADDRPVLVHIDAYRLQGPDELESIGWQPEGGELAADAVVAIEWADRVASLLGNSTLQVDLEHVTEQTRRIKITAKGYWQSRMESLSEALTVYKEVSQQ